MQIQLLNSEDFQTTYDGKQTDLITLQNTHGITTQITNYGARVVSLWVPDKEGHFEDVVLGYDTVEKYLSTKNFYGTAVGRYANRIAHSSFELEGVHYKLFDNERGSNLHGGPNGFHDVVWDLKKVGTQQVEFAYISVDGEEHFPGTLTVSLVYTLTNQNELKIEFKASTDKTTHVNLTTHSYFNLLGAGNGRIEHHELMINANHFLPTNNISIPLGNSQTVKDTPFDFRSRKEILPQLEMEDEQLEFGGGFDHTFVLDTHGDRTQLAAELYEPHFGRVLKVYTNEPGIQFYSGNFSDDPILGKWEKQYRSRGALCLETQHFPNSPNQPEFPSTVLHPGEEYVSTCIYQFAVM